MVREGRVATGPARDHTVKLDVTGLAPARWYYYRFRYDGVSSPVGRTRTAPARDAEVERLRFGVVSCANLQAGWFSVYRHLADRDDLRRGAAPRRLPLRVRPRRVRLRPVRRGHPPPRPGPRDGPARGLPPPARAVQDRPRPPAPARDVPLRHHLGRPRGRQRPVEGRRREPRRERGRLPGQARPRAPGVRRVDAGADERHRRPPRRHPAVPPFPVRQPGRAEHARPAHLPRPAGGRGRPPTPRSATRTAPSPAASSSTGSRTACAPAVRSGSWSATR